MYISWTAGQIRGDLCLGLVAPKLFYIQFKGQQFVQQCMNMCSVTLLFLPGDHKQGR